MEICPFSKQPCPHAKIAHATEVQDDLIQLQMCKICYGQYLKAPIGSVSVAEKKEVELANSLVDLLDQIYSSPIPKPVPVIKTCTCGSTLQDIAKTGKIGCDNCYKVFEAELRKSVFLYHKANKHTGKVPKNKVNHGPLLEQIAELKIKMARAIELENYEVAGVLKDKIANLQKQI